MDTELEEVIKKDEKVNDKKTIVVYNDDVNTFQWVIESLIDVCGHNPIQAEQCAWMVHHNGKCDVKSGEESELLPMARELLDRLISAKIE